MTGDAVTWRIGTSSVVWRSHWAELFLRFPAHRKRASPSINFNGFTDSDNMDWAALTRTRAAGGRVY